MSPYYALQDLKKALKRQVKSGTQFAVHLSEYPPTPADLPEELLSVAYVEEEPLTSEAVNELTVNKASGSGAVALRRRRTSDALVPTSMPAPAFGSEYADGAHSARFQQLSGPSTRWQCIEQLAGLHDYFTRTKRTPHEFKSFHMPPCHDMSG